MTEDIPKTATDDTTPHNSSPTHSPPKSLSSASSSNFAPSPQSCPAKPLLLSVDLHRPCYNGAVCDKSIQATMSFSDATLTRLSFCQSYARSRL